MSHDEEGLLRSVAMQNAQTILLARHRAEDELIRAHELLERKTEELAHSLAAMQATLESTTDAILVTDRNGEVTSLNRKFAEMWRLPHDLVDLTQHGLLSQFTAQQSVSPQSFRSRIDEIYELAPSESYDLLECTDGRIIERFSRIQYIDERNVGRVWSFRDITERRCSEEALRDETRVLELLHSTGAAIASTLDLQTLLQTVTDAGTQLSNAKFGAFVYNTTDMDGNALLLHTFSGASREAFESGGLAKATSLHGPTFCGENIIRSADLLEDSRYGTKPHNHGMPAGDLPVRSYLAVPVVSRSGNVIGGLFFGHPETNIFTERTERLIAGVAAQAAVAIDNARLYDAAQKEISERKLAQDAQKRSEERLRAAIAAAATGTFRWNIRLGNIEGDEALNKLFGFAPDHKADTFDMFMERIHPDDYPRVTQTCEQCIAQGSDFDMEYRVLWPDGTVRWLEGKARMFFDETGAPLHMTGACIDITMRKQASVDLIAARDQALDASRAKSTFLANMSHELRTPLNAVIGYAEMLEEEVRLLNNDDLSTDLGKIRQAGQHLLSLINNILDLSKIEAGKMETSLSTFDLVDVIEEVAATVDPLVMRNDNQLTVCISPLISTMYSDEMKVRQILFNLLSNATKFTERGDITIDVREEHDSHGEWILFQVSDTGIGMTPEELGVLFQDFSQVDSSTTRRHEGTGLGLSICRRFCHMLGGQIAVHSEKAKGSIFTVRLPNKA